MPALSDTLRQLILLNFMNRPSACFRPSLPLFSKRGNKRGNFFSASASFLGLCTGLTGTLISTQTLAQTTAAAQIHTALSAYYEQERDDMAAREGWTSLKQTTTNTPLNAVQQLAACHKELDIQPSTSSAQSGRQVVTLTCPSPHWAIKVSSEIRYLLPIVKTQRIIDRGDTITRDALKLEEADITRLRRGFYHHVGDVEGLSAKRRLRANQLLSPELVDAPLMVRRGEAVTIVANKEGISASMKGEALANGAKNEVIRVKNVTSNKIIDAKIIDTGIVTSTF